uniref:Uncharacterized protein n=1 Tax=Fagus sylvatica TaxID=28930 RepID=A0A2N9EZP0_FAGSY
MPRIQSSKPPTNRETPNPNTHHPNNHILPNDYKLRRIKGLSNLLTSHGEDIEVEPPVEALEVMVITTYVATIKEDGLVVTVEAKAKGMMVGKRKWGSHPRAWVCSAWLGLTVSAPIWAWVCSAWLGLTVSVPIWAWVCSAWLRLTVSAPIWVWVCSVWAWVSLISHSLSW